MVLKLKRRDFLKLAGLGAGVSFIKPPPPISLLKPLGLGRVGDTWIGLYEEPSFRAPLLTTIKRDTLLTLLKREVADEGPLHNPLWYQVPDGYVHSGKIQQVKWNTQAPWKEIPETGGLFEVSVPYTRSYRKPDLESDPLYRLYYQSIAWVEALVEGADGRLWYQLLDDLLKVNYFVRAEHLRRIKPEELIPISPGVPSGAKRIDVSLASQELMAYEHDRLVFRTRIASGVQDSRPRPNGIPTATPQGRFYITQKMPLRHMGDGHLTANLEAYELPGVPWVSYFHDTGVAFHGTYWHCDYGRPQSHGCINMRPEEAKWLFRWSTPVIEADVILETGHGTSVAVY